MNRTVVSILLLSILVSCKSSVDNIVPQKTVNTEQVAQSKVENNFETLPSEIREKLAQETTSIEATMYESGGSFSLSDAKNALRFVEFLIDETPKELSNHQIGHIMFLKNGQEILFINVFKVGEQAYIKYSDTANNKSYYNVLGGEAANMFLNLKLQTK